MRADRERDTTWWLVAVFAISALLHVGAWAVLGMLPSAAEFMASERQRSEIDVEVLPPEPIPEAEPEPEAESSPEPEPEPEPELPRPRPRPEPAQAPEPEPARPEPPAEEEAIADFTGETLTNDTGAAWTSAVGNGEPMDGPIGQPNARVTGRRREGVQGGVPGGSGAPAGEEGPRVVAFADLSRRPSPHGDMNRVLQANYPPRARQLAIEGRVEMAFRIQPDGSVARFRVRSESPGGQGFADACRRTIQQLHWDPPLDRGGEAVATDASFECEFAVGL